MSENSYVKFAAEFHLSNKQGKELKRRLKGLNQKERDALTCSFIALAIGKSKPFDKMTDDEKRFIAYAANLIKT